MPKLTIKMAKGRPVEMKRNLIKAVTEAISSSLELSPEKVTVLIDEFDRENLATGGELHSDKFGEGYTCK